MAVRVVVIAAMLGLAGCAHAPIGRYGVTAAAVHASGPGAQAIAANGDFVVRTRRCALYRADLRSILAMLERAPTVSERSEDSHDYDPGPRDYDPLYSPNPRYVIRLERGRRAPLLLFFKPREEPVREVTVVLFDGVRRQLGFADTQMLQQAVARAGCATWAQKDAGAI